ncbi:MAG: (2Fe-2S)-binding protein [Planctomycetes bacterium]|nr:(2Fe-2S)-binding protein [Planctomycetota bacterium]
MSGAVNMTVDGRPVQARGGQNVLGACLEAGVHVPHYCYHPGLSVAGNCRMCMVEIEGQRTPTVTGCTTPVAEGMAVRTSTPKVRAAQEAVLEYLLANHPLDCPVCDQAGECDLQDFSFRHGRGQGRFHEEKVVKHIKDLGPRVKFWGTRCIVCTRCVRFCQEVSGTGELSVIERGDHSVIDTFPGIPLDNELAGNTVDICPVGALLSSDFLYRARVWFLRATPTVCATCSKGCDITVETLEGEVQRVRPRPNPDVNEWWMCDRGRHDLDYVASPDRLASALLEGGASATSDVVARVAESLRAHAGRVAVLVSAWQTVEAAWLAQRLAQALGGRTALVARPDVPGRVYPRFRIEDDANPNRAGVERVLGPAGGPGAGAVLADLTAGRLTAALVLGGMPRWEPPPALVAALERARFVAVVDILRGPLVDLADAVLAGAAFVEKDGVYLNSAGRAQRLRRALDPPGEALCEELLLQRLLAALGHWEAGEVSAGAVFGMAAAAVPALAGLDHQGLGELGRLAGVAPSQ